MRIWWLIFEAPPDGNWKRRQTLLKTVLLFMFVTAIINILCCDGCVHDKLNPTRGQSPQKYSLNLKTILRLKHKRKLLPTVLPGKFLTSQPLTKKGYYFKYNRHQNDNETNNRPKRYVEGGRRKGNGTRNITATAAGKRTPNGGKFTRRMNGTVVTNVTNSSYQTTADFRKLFKPIRIKLIFDDDHIEYSNTSEEYKRLNKSLHRAVQTMEKILSVIPVEGPLLFSRTPERICGSFWSDSSFLPDSKKEKKCAIASNSYGGEKCLDEFKIPEDHLRGYSIYKSKSEEPTHVLYENGTGIPDTDTVIYVHAEKTNLCNDKGVIAYATYCQLDQFNRPIAGFANLCPSHLADIQYNEEVLYLTSLHEFFHALGFSKDLFDKFQECRPKRVEKPSDDTEKDNDMYLNEGWYQGSICFISPEGLIDVRSYAKKAEEMNGNKTSEIEWTCETKKNVVSFIDNRKHIVTPAVTREVQKHLNCSSKRGCPLENHVVPPLQTSSHWEDRFMQGSLMAPIIGLPHLTVIDRMTLGAFEDMGWYQVDYSYANDLLWGKDAGCEFATGRSCFNKSSPYFCQRGLSSVQNGCHFLHGDKGRCESNDYLEGCRVYKARAGNECWRSRNETRLSEWKGEIFSRESRCFISDLVYQDTKFQPTKSTRMLEGRCYQHRCNDSHTLEVKVDGSEYKVCPEGLSITFSGYGGHLRCPSTSLLCGFEFDTTTAPAVGPTSATGRSNPYCAKIVFTFPKLATLHVQMKGRENKADVAREAQHKLDMFIAKFVNEIVAVTDIDQTRVVDIKFISNVAVQFTLLRNIDWTTFTPKDPESSLSPGEYDTEEIGDEVRFPTKYNYVEVSCIEAVRRLLVSVTDGNFKVPVDGELFKADKMNFTDSNSEMKELQTEINNPKEKPPRTGMLAAVAVGSICGAMLIAVGVMIYWKSQITTAVSPAPPSPTSTDVRYQPNGSTTVAPSENGSVGQLAFVA